MDRIRISIESDFINDTDEMRKLTLKLKNELEELEIEDIEIPTKENDEDAERGKGLIDEWGTLILPLVLSPAVTIAMIKSIHLWIKSNANKTIAKTVTIDINKQKYVFKGYSDDEVINVLDKLKLGE